MNLWRIELNNGDWFLWFAKRKTNALTSLQSEHFPDLTFTRFLIEYEPRTKQVGDDELISAETTEGTQTRTAAEWCEGQSGGPFSSNTYEV